MKLSALTIFIFFFFELTAQTYVDIPWREGAIMKAGNQENGMIRLGGDTGAPWLNHTKVYFVPEKDFPADLHPKGKVIIEYKPEDIDGYFIHDRDSSDQAWMTFVTMEILLVKGLGKKMTKVFLREMEKGAVTFYSFIPQPDDNSAAEKEYAFNHSTTYFKKGDGPLISAVECDMASLLSECPEVVSKIKSGAYGYVDFNEREKKKGFGKILADNAGDNELEGKLIKSVRDYNACVK